MNCSATVGHLRTRDGGHQTDLIVERYDGQVVALEVKLSSMINDSDARHLHWLGNQLGPRPTDVPTEWQSCRSHCSDDRAPTASAPHCHSCRPLRPAATSPTTIRLVVDPRVIRTRSSLRDAVLRLASRTPVEDLTREEVCEASGVSRATFYRHAASASELLVQVMHEDLDAQRIDFVHEAIGTGEELRAVHRRLIARFADHIEEFADAYALSLPSDCSVLRPVLQAHIYAAAAGYVRLRCADIDLTQRSDRAEQEFLVEALARNFSAGQLGIIEAWCTTGPRVREQLEELMLELAPAWNRRLMAL